MAAKGTTIKDTIKIFEEKKGVVVAEVEKVRHVNDVSSICFSKLRKHQV